jgi:hypothetical protein
MKVFFTHKITRYEKNMSKNNEANRKKNKDKINQKKRKLQTAEAERKARLKQIREDFKAREDNKL